ncbi:hypothetical protein PS15m_009393 [Mucor circinelloides]
MKLDSVTDSLIIASIVLSPRSSHLTPYPHIKSLSSNTVNQQQPTSSDMKIDSKPFGKISKEEGDRRNNSRACYYYCEGPSHFRKECLKANTGHRLNTFILTAAFTSQPEKPVFNSLPMSHDVVSETTTTTTHLQIPHADNGLIFVPLVFGNIALNNNTRREYKPYWILPVLLPTQSSVMVLPIRSIYLGIQSPQTTPASSLSW